MTDPVLIDNHLLALLETDAKSNSRKRQAFDLRTSENDSSQRMLNVLIPGTVIPVHRHRGSSETMIVLRGSLIELFYDDNGHEILRLRLEADGDKFGIQIPAGQWHTVEVIEPCMIIEVKDGSYTPLSQEDILEMA